jgi:hypothetical protein
MGTRNIQMLSATRSRWARISKIRSAPQGYLTRGKPEVVGKAYLDRVGSDQIACIPKTGRNCRTLRIE